MNQPPWARCKEAAAPPGLAPQLSAGPASRGWKKKKKAGGGKSQPGGGRSPHGPRAPLVHPRSNSRVPTNGSRGPRSRNLVGRQSPAPGRKTNPGAPQASARTFPSFSPSLPPFPLQLVFTFSRHLPEYPKLDAFSKVIPSHSLGRKPHSW